MRSELTWIAGAIAALTAGVAEAQPARSATFNVTFEDVANDCSEKGMTLTAKTVRLDQKTPKIVTVTVPKVPAMTGRRGRTGKFNAQSKKGPTPLQGVSGKFSAAGTAKGGQIDFVFIAEFYRGAKPLCTQSWHASGSRK